MRKIKTYRLQILVHILVLMPLVILVSDFAQDQLTANPIQEVQLRTGRYALILLMLTLACTPAYNVFGIKQALWLRRLLGLYTFAYAGLHFLNFIGLDYGFDFALMREDIATKRFILAGFAALIILSALAVTSTTGWKKRLGKSWERLHQLIYGAALLAVLHFIWQAKLDLRVPFIYAGIVVLLLVVRIPQISEAMKVCTKWMKRRQVDL